MSRELFGYSIAWSEELATYMFVWFAYFGASYAAKLYAHNRVTFQFGKLPRTGGELHRRISPICSGFSSIATSSTSASPLCFFKMNLFWKSQTLGVPMKYIYMVLPIAFTLMTIPVIQAQLPAKLVKGIDVRDPEKGWRSKK